MLRLNHINFTKPEIENSAPLEESAGVNEGEESIMDTTVHERPIPHILMVLKSKVLKVGQISLHLLSSPLGNEMDHDSLKWEGMEFPYSFPPVNHLTTLLCIGNPDDPSASSFDLSMTQSEENRKLFKIKSKIT